MKKTVQVSMLPSNLNKIEEGQLFNCYSNLGIARGSFLNTQDYKPQHLYFTSNEEIKEGDWCISLEEDSFIWQNNRAIDHETWVNSLKVIATTDKSLNLPLIPQSFIDKYVSKNGEIKETQIEWSPNRDKPVLYTPDALEDLHVYINEDLPKKQTLKEAADEYCNTPFIKNSPMYKTILEAVKFGAKWQQSQS